MDNSNLESKFKSIEIVGLFDLFDYKIEYPSDDNVLIITGPNGFGKTQVLNIIYNLFNRKFLFFNKLVFSKITLCLTNSITIEISSIKTGFSENSNDNKNGLKVANIVFLNHDKIVESFSYSIDNTESFTKLFERILPLRKLSIDSWIDLRTDQLIDFDEVIQTYGDQIPSDFSFGSPKIQTDIANNFLNSIQVHLIKEQRLFKKVQNPDRSYRNDRDQTIMIDTIQTYADELISLINQKLQQSYIISQQLDSTYPNRLISENKTISKVEYDRRFEVLTQKQEILTRNGLYEMKQDVLTFSESDSKALLVYLNDLEKKLNVFDELLEKLELFTGILNERRFTYKSIFIDRERGFYFKTSGDKLLKLNDLSSGEQHEVVLLYELIFKTKPGIMVLIDEPEISLHVTWQKEFLNDILRIIKIQNFQVIIATHSPSIINERWDLVYNLEK